MITTARETKGQQDQRLRYRPSLLKHRYGMLIRYFEGEAETLKLHYGISLSGVGDATGGLAAVTIDREQVYINNQAPQLLAEQMADAMGKCLFPVKVQVHANGSMGAVLNDAEIQARWRKAKPAMEQYYKGDVADSVFNLMEAQLSSERYITGSLKKDLFFALYFQGMYDHRLTGAGSRTELHFPFTAFGTPVGFAVTASPEEAANGKIGIQLKGACKDDRSFRDIINKKILASDPGGSKVQGNIDLVYKFYPETHIIYSIVGFVQLSDGQQSRSIAIELFHQPGNNTEARAQRKPQQNIIEEEQVVTRKPFWALFKK